MRRHTLVTYHNVRLVVRSRIGVFDAKVISPWLPLEVILDAVLASLRGFAISNDIHIPRAIWKHTALSGLWRWFLANSSIAFVLPQTVQVNSTVLLPTQLRHRIYAFPDSTYAWPLSATALRRRPS
jgi:hypothetical protein